MQMHKNISLSVKVLLVCALFTGSASASPVTGVQEMSACTADDQCVVVPELCNGWTAVSRKSEEAYTSYRKKMLPLVSCPVAEETPKPASAQCLYQVCKVKN